MLKQWKQLAKATTPRSPAAAAEKKEPVAKEEEKEAMPTTSSQTDVPPLPSNADSLRKKAREKFEDVLGNAAAAARVEVAMLKRFPYEQDAVLRLDDGLGRAAAARVNGGFKKDYKSKFMMLFTNLKRNKVLAKQVADGFIEPAK